IESQRGALVSARGELRALGRQATPRLEVEGEAQESHVRPAEHPGRILDGNFEAPPAVVARDVADAVGEAEPPSTIFTIEPAEEGHDLQRQLVLVDQNRRLNDGTVHRELTVRNEL